MKIIKNIIDSFERLLWGPKWICQYENGVVVEIRANTRGEAQRQLMRLIRDQIYGSLTLTYNPVKVRKYFRKFNIIQEKNNIVKEE